MWHALNRPVRLFAVLAVSWCAILTALPGAADVGTAGVQMARLEPGPEASTRSATAGPLSDRDAALYRRIFAVQEKGDWAGADALIAKVRDPLLMGHVQFQRYMHPTAYRSSYAELSAWLERYADHPDADRVYRLAWKRRPAGAGPLSEPVRGYLAGAGQELQELPRLRYRPRTERSAQQEEMVRAWQRGIERLAAQDETSAALAELDRQEIRGLIDDVEADVALWTIAKASFAERRDQEAYRLAARAAKRSGSIVPEMHWLAGISAWRLGRIESAAAHFAALAEADDAHPAERSRAAFWAARAQLVTGQPELVGHFLGIAAASSRHFYGLLARAVLGEPLAYNWDEIGLQHRVRRVLMQHAGARRAMALGQIDRTERAEAEIRKLAVRAEPELMTGLIALAESLHLPAAQMRLAQRLGSVQGDHHHGALYPVPRWQPDTGLRLDRALIFAIIRAESAFDPNAESHVGARGLMQVMPATARMMGRVAALGAPIGDALFEPEVSMAYGQAYLEHLLQYRWIGDNLIYVAAGYNAGPGRVREWQKELGTEHDPLVFLESIPMTEPRVYVKKVLTNLWTYRARLGQAQPSLEALAGNRWPTYHALDAKPILYAWY